MTNLEDKKQIIVSEKRHLVDDVNDGLTDDELLSISLAVIDSLEYCDCHDCEVM